MSIRVAIDDLFEQIGEWGPGYLLTVSDDDRTHLLALRPSVVGTGAERVLRLDAGGGRAVGNATARPAVTLLFPPGDDGYSLVVDGDAAVHGSLVDVRPTSALLHRPAP
ncbi:MAG: hypothetical protein QNJ12_10330 [Ilumatobacter sp.]|uniref:hypothetical protein n=1 Tax=Ilumatobacter sp. TaxID=1967498 RepID=UPI00262B109A|nr:hypothetical protein [Ilumatobacter sp.]MDJ0769183.1 hypothetical protein [Ilumatobacter sp.]